MICSQIQPEFAGTTANTLFFAVFKAAESHPAAMDGAMNLAALVFGPESAILEGDDGMHRRIGPFHSITVFGGATIDRIAQTAARAGHGLVQSGRRCGRRRAGSASISPRPSPASAVGTAGGNRRRGSRRRRDHRRRPKTRASTPTASGDLRPSPTAAYHASLDDSGSLIVGIADMKIYDEIDPRRSSRPRQPRAARRPLDRRRQPSRRDARLPGRRGRGDGRQVVALTVSPAKAVRLSPAPRPPQPPLHQPARGDGVSSATTPPESRRRRAPSPARSAGG